MAFEAPFLDLMASVVTVTPSSTRDSYGKTTYGTAVANVPAKVSYKTGVQRRPNNEDVGYSASAWLPPAGYVSGSVTVPTVGLNDKVTLPDGVVRTVVAVDRPLDEDGVIHHQAVRLG